MEMLFGVPPGPRSGATWEDSPRLGCRRLILKGRALAGVLV